jgi:hypothetical protein
MVLLSLLLSSAEVSVLVKDAASVSSNDLLLVLELLGLFVSAFASALAPVSALVGVAVGVAMNAPAHSPLIIVVELSPDAGTAGEAVSFNFNDAVSEVMM